MPVAASVRNPHTAEDCTDEFCPRLPCRMFKEGFRRGYEKGFDEGYAAGPMAPGTPMVPHPARAGGEGS